MKRFILYLVVWSMVFSFALVNTASAASTIGVDILTTGSLTVRSSSTTAIRFQNSSSTTIFQFDTTNSRLGIGTAPVTTFEVQGTASASYFIASGSVQFGSNVATAAYSRFGGTATTHTGTISTADDLIISGGLEVNGSTAFDGFVLFGSGASISTNFEVTGDKRLGINAGNLTDTSFEVGGTASISGIITLGGLGTTGGQVRPGVNGTTAFRFQNAAGTTNVLTIDTTNTRVGIGTTPVTTFEVQGTASASYFIASGSVQFGSNVATAAYSRFGGTATGHASYISNANDLLISGDAEVIGTGSFGTVASVGTNFNVGEISAATTSVTFEANAAAKGVCFIVTGSDGTDYFARITASAGSAPKWWITTISCR
ncbi:MAG: exported protein of unknown function [Parcubacteria group bacterium Gr01-1014_2]|nr:MAG: exported protein of unknown function [Parcubacteria group bacterium Gr01-1014_2]